MSDTPDMPENGNTQNLFDFDRSKGNFSFPERHKFDAGYGLTEATIDYICDVKETGMGAPVPQKRACRF